MKYFGNQLHLLIGFASRSAFEELGHFRLPFAIDFRGGHLLQRLVEIIGLDRADQKTVAAQEERIVVPSAWRKAFSISGQTALWRCSYSRKRSRFT